MEASLCRWRGRGISCSNPTRDVTGGASGAPWPRARIACAGVARQLRQLREIAETSRRSCACVQPVYASVTTDRRRSEESDATGISQGRVPDADGETSDHGSSWPRSRHPEPRRRCRWCSALPRSFCFSTMVTAQKHRAKRMRSAFAHRRPHGRRRSTPRPPPRALSTVALPSLDRHTGRCAWNSHEGYAPVSRSTTLIHISRL
jgi:hypothetical protein